MIRFDKKEVRRVSLVLAGLIIAWSIKSFITEESQQKAWESIGLFIGLLVLLMLIAITAMVLLWLFRKVYELIFRRNEN